MSQEEDSPDVYSVSTDGYSADEHRQIFVFLNDLLKPHTRKTRVAEVMLKEIQRVFSSKDKENFEVNRIDSGYEFRSLLGMLCCSLTDVDEGIKLLVSEYGADVNLKQGIQATKTEGYTLLIACANQGNLLGSTFLLWKGANPWPAGCFEKRSTTLAERYACEAFEGVKYASGKIKAESIWRLLFSLRSDGPRNGNGARARVCHACYHPCDLPGCIKCGRYWHHDCLGMKKEPGANWTCLRCVVVAKHGEYKVARREVGKIPCPCGESNDEEHKVCRKTNCFYGKFHARCFKTVLREYAHRPDPVHLDDVCGICVDEQNSAEDAALNEATLSSSSEEHLEQAIYEPENTASHMLLGLQGQNAAGGSGGSTFPQASVAGLSSGSSSGSAFAQRLLVSGAGQALANMHVSSQSSSTAMQEDDDFDLTRWISKKNQKVSALKTQITQLGVEREALRVENQQLRVDNHVENQQLRVENQQQQMRIQELEAQQLQDKQQYEAQQLQDRQQYKEDIKKASLRNDELDSRRRLKVSELETHVEELTATVAALQAEQTDIDELQAMMKKISNKRARGGETSGSSSRGIDDDGWQNV